MQKRIFKQKGSGVYRLRYRIDGNPRLFDVSLRTSNLEVAQAKADEIVLEAEKAVLGIGIPRPLREAQKRTLAEHLGDYIAFLQDRQRSESHVSHAQGRLERLFRECRWQYLTDVDASAFLDWRTRNTALSQKTRNEYLAHANAFFNWLDRQNRIVGNPLRGVYKLSTQGQETFVRRSLTFDEAGRLIVQSGKRSLVYLVAIATGLRRNELKQLRWSDLHLDCDTPHVLLRAETTKAKRADVIPIVPVLAELLRAMKARLRDTSLLVFRRGIVRPKTLAADLEAAGIEVETEHGRVDVHALRHTYVSLMAEAGVSELARVKAARHRSWKLTDNYTDPQRLPMHAEMGKFGDKLSSLLASLNFGKNGAKQGNAVQSDAEKFAHAKIVSDDSEAILVGSDGSDASAEWRRGGDSNPR